MGVVSETGVTVWNGLRVRMGIHVGEPLLSVDPANRRTGYSGPAVNRAARIQELAAGGQILMSRSVAALLREELTAAGQDPHHLVMNFDGTSAGTTVLTTPSVGQFTLKGVSGRVAIHALVPSILEEREFPTLVPAAADPLQVRCRTDSISQCSRRSYLPSEGPPNSARRIRVKTSTVYGSPSNIYSPTSSATTTPGTSGSVPNRAAGQLVESREALETDTVLSSDLLLP
eukprot:NODE_937_length_1131_cov_334.399261_g650_i0.p1 GENE.NODE_937_length_1131_cov_334.399261_g650_i0~~NODE_937_length_1131_cov_334.399261_g650_i0.p1  ORF type:complete len:239 (+),score=68.22 NODE_937_length_1131_cov_334.399261_g650_i0:28-717(+)